MKKILSVLSALVVMAPVMAQAGEAPRVGPPKIIEMIREEVKPGRGPAHDRASAAWPPAFAKAKWPVHYLGMNSITGPNEALFLVGHDSFAAIDRDFKAVEKMPALKADLDRLSQQDADLVAGFRNVIAFHRADLSYRAATVNVAKMRYITIYTFRVRPGRDREFAEAAKIIRDAYEKAQVDIPWAIYQAFYGAPSGTYYVLVPMKSLAEIDAAIGYAKALQEAEGPEGVKRLEEISRAAYLGSETNIYAFNPKTSYVSPEFAAADPEFWTPKAARKPGAAKSPTRDYKIPEQPVKK